MTKKTVNRVDRNLARRLLEARREAGLSTRGACANLPPKLAVSRTTLSSYENGTTRPPIDVLAALADLYSRPINWFLENRESLSGFRYRNLRHRSSVVEKRKFEAQAGKWAEAYLKLDKFLASPGKSPFAVPESDIALPAPELALAIRRNLLGVADVERIENVVRVLESFSAWALEVKTSLEIDGAAAQHGNAMVVIFNPAVPNERMRLAAALELAYLVYESCQPELRLGAAALEKRAYSFATALLLPHSQLVEAFRHRSLLKLFEYKERFGVSIAVMIHMAEHSRLISTSVSRSLWSEVVRRRWQHNEPGFVWRDRAISFEMMLDSAIHTKRLTWDDAERVTGIPAGELRQRISVLYDDATAPITGDLEPEVQGVPQLRLFANADEDVAGA